MAIQRRRGNYADLDTSRLVQGEPFVTLDQHDGDYYVGMAIAPSTVVRLATWSNLVDIRTDCETYRDEAHTSATNAASSESNSEAWAVGQRGGSDVPNTDPTYENNSKYYAQQAGDYWSYVDEAITLVVPSVNINFTTGQLEVAGSSWYFSINETTGYLEYAVSHI